jgi:AraC-like DNA-binding protein
MNQNLLSLSHGDLIWNDNLPSEFKAVRLPGSTIATAVGEFGTVCIQEYSNEYFSIRFNVLDLLQHFVLQSFTKQNGIHSRVVLKGNVNHELNEKSNYTLRKNQFILINAEKKLSTEVYEKNTHIIFDTFLPLGPAKELLHLFPKANIDAANVQWGDMDTLEQIHSILNCKYEKDLRRHYYDSRVKDLFFKQLVIITSTITIDKAPSEQEITAVYKAEEIISNNISEHYPIPELSKKVLLNEFRLKQLFKKVFGTGPYEYLIRKRLQKAKELLESGLSVKETAAQVGYRPSDFTTAFRNHFGIAPGEIKKRKS